MISISKALARRAISRPIMPKPISPRVLDRSSFPVSFFFSHLPAFMDVFAGAIRRASASISAKLCSATLTAFPPGVFMTTIPFWVAAGRSTLSTPTPARPITRNRAACPSSSAVAFVALRTMSASASLISSVMDAPGFLGRKTTSQDASARSTSRALSETLSATRIFIMNAP